jgi:hypothetical protein
VIRIKGDAALEKEVAREVRKRLRARREEAPDYGELWRQVLQRRPLAMVRAEYVRFRVLHRQFGGRLTPLLPQAVSLARFVIKRVPRLKRRLEN